MNHLYLKTKILAAVMILAFLPTTLLAKTNLEVNPKLNCQMKEFKNGETTIQSFTVEGNQSAHGEMHIFRSLVFPEVTGFVSLMLRDQKNFAVLNLYSETMQFGSSSQHQLMQSNESTPSQHIQHQFIIPSKEIQLSGIEITCESVL